MTRPTPELMELIRRIALEEHPCLVELLVEIDALTAERDEARNAVTAEAYRADECHRDMQAAWRERDAEIARCRRLLSLLDRASTGTRPDGSGCWCDPDEWEAEFGREECARGGRHTALCREIAAALQ